MIFEKQKVVVQLQFVLSNVKGLSLLGLSKNTLKALGGQVKEKGGKEVNVEGRSKQGGRKWESTKSKDKKRIYKT